MKVKKNNSAILKELRENILGISLAVSFWSLFGAALIFGGGEMRDENNKKVYLAEYNDQLYLFSNTELDSEYYIETDNVYADKSGLTFKINGDTYHTSDYICLKIDSGKDLGNLDNIIINHDQKTLSKKLNLK